jgi:hypothetical protein
MLLETDFLILVLIRKFHKSFFNHSMYSFLTQSTARIIWIKHLHSGLNHLHNTEYVIHIQPNTRTAIQTSLFLFPL